MNRAWQLTEICKWRYAIEEAVGLIPEHSMETTGEATEEKIKPFSFEFWVDDTVWNTAFAGYPISINIKPSLDLSSMPSWLTWEPFSENGFTRLEMVFIILHEINHSIWWYPSFFDEPASTLYGQAVGPLEDYAETGALYIMWPDYLKQNFPKHYEAAKEFFRKEFASYRCMPRSIKTRLTKPFDVKICE